MLVVLEAKVLFDITEVSVIVVLLVALMAVAGVPLVFKLTVSALVFDMSRLLGRPLVCACTNAGVSTRSEAPRADNFIERN